VPADAGEAHFACSTCRLPEASAAAAVFCGGFSVIRGAGPAVGPAWYGLLLTSGLGMGVTSSLWGSAAIGVVDPEPAGCCAHDLVDSGIARPARIYDLRSTFASNALAAGLTVFELAKVMGTSGAMIERHYGTLIGGAHAGIAGRLDALEAELEEAAENEAGRLNAVTRSRPRSVDRT
jgi:hypothetical protein